MTSYFITGTDTDCGKTYVTCQLIAHFRAKGLKPFAFKPIASGCTRQNDVLVSGDVNALTAALGDSPPRPVHQWLFEPPISPHIAAQEASVTLLAKDVASAIQTAHTHEADCFLIEGAGGLMVPINANETWLDVLAHLSIPTLIVVGMRLGCINHALLTAHALQSHHLPCSGWIANEIDPGFLRPQENLETLKRMMPVPLLGVVKHGGSATWHLG